MTPIKSAESGRPVDGTKCKSGNLRVCSALCSRDKVLILQFGLRSVGENPVLRARQERTQGSEKRRCSVVKTVPAAVGTAGVTRCALCLLGPSRFLFFSATVGGLFFFINHGIV